MAKKQITNEYKVFFTEIKEKIYKAQYEAMKQVNVTLIQLYWDIGKVLWKSSRYTNGGNLLLKN